MKNAKKLLLAVAVLLAPLLLSNCSETNKSNTSVKLVVTNEQLLQQIDLLNSAGCDRTLGTILMQVVPLQNSASATLPTDPRLSDVQVTRYRVTYTRTDGGTQVPASFVRNISILIPFNSPATSSSSFLVLEPDALNQAPFAALSPVNGGRDPQTGKSFIKIDIAVEVFGTTLAGENVSGVTHIPVNFCYDCGGCF